MAWHKGLYPQWWPEISWYIKAAANWRCQGCDAVHDPGLGFTLTIHHRDGNPENNRLDNLWVCCQRCHLREQGRLYRDRVAPGQVAFDF